MKTARRHELHTNELSQQIEEMLSYAQQHGWRILTAVVAVVVVVGGIYAFVSSRRNAVSNAWAEYVRGPAGSSPIEQISFYKDLAAQEVEPMLTAASLFRAGQLALGESSKPTNSETQRSDYAKQADDFYKQVCDRFPELIVPASNARLALGIVLENRGDYGGARGIYEKLANDGRLKEYPAGLQALYRMKNLTGWEPAITFPPPPPPPASAPASGSASAESAAKMAAETQPADAEPLSIRAATQATSP